MPKELTWQKAIDKVLAASSMPLHYNEITERIISDGLRHNLGATPSATVNAHISASIKHKGDSSPYVRISKGTVALSKPKIPPEIPESRGVGRAI
jgi:hypothetical protein